MGGQPADRHSPLQNHAYRVAGFAGRADTLCICRSVDSADKTRTDFSVNQLQLAFPVAATCSVRDRSMLLLLLLHFLFDASDCKSYLFRRIVPEQ